MTSEFRRNWDILTLYGFTLCKSLTFKARVCNFLPLLYYQLFTKPLITSWNYEIHTIFPYFTMSFTNSFLHSLKCDLTYYKPSIIFNASLHPRCSREAFIPIQLLPFLYSFLMLDENFYSVKATLTWTRMHSCINHVQICSSYITEIIKEIFAVCIIFLPQKYRSVISSCVRENCAGKRRLILWFSQWFC